MKTLLYLTALAQMLFAAHIVRADTLTATSSSPASTEGMSFTGTLGSFTDSTADPVSNYSVTINWGDGTSPVAGTVTGAGTYSISGTHTYLEEGLYTVALSVTDSDGTSATTTGTFTVTDATLTASATPFLFTPSVATAFSGSFSDANLFGTASDFNTTILWGDGSTSAGTVTSVSPGNFAVSGIHTYTTSGAFDVSLIVNDIGGSTAGATVLATSTTSPVPEPSSLLLLGTGLVGMLGAVRRKLTAR